VILRGKTKGGGAVFPSEFLDKKRYRALSDGFRTAFDVSSDGRVLGLMDLQAEGDPTCNSAVRSAHDVNGLR
jgi:hypothetical protein